MTEKTDPQDPTKKDAAASPPPTDDSKKVTTSINEKPVTAIEAETQALIDKMLKNRKQSGDKPAPAPAAADKPMDNKPSSAPSSAGGSPAWPDSAKSLGDSQPVAKPTDAPTPIKPMPPTAAAPAEASGTARLNRPPAEPEARAVPVDAAPVSKEEAKSAARTTNVSRNVPGRGKQEVWKVIFQPMAASEVKELGVEVKGLMIVGRVEEGAPSKPDLDLNPFDAGSFGVSRMHVIITPSSEGPCITDMNSTNGTWINGLYLEPGRQYRLRSNDRVELGTLKLLVKVIGPNENQG